MLASLPLHPPLHRALALLGFTEATPVQAKAIPAALEGKDLMVSAETGSGKTVAFLLPVLNKLLDENPPNTGTRALILLPTRELAIQIKKTCDILAKFTHINTGLIIGGEAFKHQIATLRKNPEILIATPGRLVEHIERGTPDFSDLEVLVLDEADRMLDMGFSDAMKTIASTCSPSRQNLLFSATLKHGTIYSIASELLSEPVSIRINTAREQPSTITHQRILADNTTHKEQLTYALIQETEASVIVFCNTRAQSIQLGNFLGYKKVKVGILHGEIAQNDRKQILNHFRFGHSQVLVTTDVAARGLDIDNIALVINFDVAHKGDDYTHRCGRTGRAGKEGTALTLVDASEWNRMSSIERYLKLTIETRKIKGLTANYKGPKKVKASGKTAGKKKKPQDKKLKRPVKKTGSGISHDGTTPFKRKVTQ